MKFTSCTTLAALVLGFAGLIKASASELDLLETLRPSAKQAISEFGQIDAERKKDLKEASAFIRERIKQGKPADLTFICTHNSRRSHLSQLWAQTAASFYGMTNVTTYSGGTEVAACNIRTVRALRRAGFSIVQSNGGTNPIYLAQFSDAQPAVKMYSKLFAGAENPQKDFAALFCCDQAAGTCPVVQGAALRLPVLYVDPKVSDNSPMEQATYDERSHQIAREMFYLMSQVKEGK
jgi:arsenate reductase